ncbi:cell division protein FtsQ/DivIB [Nonlabens ponticola]|uniref:Cell division protein n=1 Tax=Nonlabens ponticola TaxID=2496866 RepID=A0A3S9N110_9FLAO|nr:cell division protein FtsQ/DivIB [Nonlabens ponticola]AZQ45079.1 cell division protein [Nonlabens ponticola]
MKQYENHIILSLVLVAIIALYGFADHRHESQKVEDVTVSFTDYKEPLISQENVNKLLIQSEDTLQNLTVEKLDLNRSELSLENNAMIRAAQVSVDLKGRMHVIVEQRVPVARIIADSSFYLDKENKIMPLSQEYAARVPLVMGYHSSDQDEVYELISFLRNDEYMESMVTQIDMSNSENVICSLRALDFDIALGNVEDLQTKFYNFKAMMAQLEKNEAMDEVKRLDLRFDNQVVVIKK